MITLVLIPGLLSDARVWAPVAKAVRDYRVYEADVTLDLSIDSMAARVLAETDGSLVVVGHSMGARVAMEIAHQAPDRVKGMVLANTGHHPLKEGEPEKRQAKIDQGHADFAGMIKGWLPPMVAASRHDDADLIADLTQMALSIGPDIHEQQIKALVARPNASVYLAQINCPVLLLTGTEDVWSPIAQHEEIAARVSGEAVVTVTENAGHFLPVEQPDQTTKLITDWLVEKGFH